jgi:hypothetical protein
MSIADELMNKAQRFYALAHAASNPATKLQLVCLADDYVRQANELRRAHVARDRWPTDEFLNLPI